MKLEVYLKSIAATKSKTGRIDEGKADEECCVFCLEVEIQ